MFPTEGRAQKRIRQSVPLELSKQNPYDAETTVTENISSIGARVLSWRSIEPNERLMIKFLELNLRTHACVAYCERLRHGKFGVGLQFQGLAIARGAKEFSAYEFPER
jgi:PilZ domain